MSISSPRARGVLLVRSTSSSRLISGITRILEGKKCRFPLSPLHCTKLFQFLDCFASEGFVPGRRFACPGYACCVYPSSPACGRGAGGERAPDAGAASCKFPFSSSHRARWFSYRLPDRRGLRIHLPGLHL